MHIHRGYLLELFRQKHLICRNYLIKADTSQMSIGAGWPCLWVLAFIVLVWIANVKVILLSSAHAEICFMLYEANVTMYIGLDCFN